MRLVDLMREKLIFGAFLQYYLKSYLRIFSDTFEGIDDEVKSFQCDSCVELISLAADRPFEHHDSARTQSDSNIPLPDPHEAQA